MKKSASSKSVSKKKKTAAAAAPQTNEPASSAGRENFLVVGLGASAGGIQALKAFFENVPADSGMAYVVILHLSPDHDSQLAAVLQAVTQIPVKQVVEKTHLQPDHVYVVPPNQSLKMSDGHIVVEPIKTVEERRAPVDIFFRTLAETHREQSVCVVLSGTGANGSMGLKRVKERGGAAFVQNPREAEFSEMPRNSIATDLVDAILNVAEIPAKIIAYKESLGKVEIPVEPERRPDDDQQALREIFTQLRVRTGHDFSNYKRATVLRRIERRMGVNELENLPAYAAYVRDNIDETRALLKDLLISVTNFFRDKEAFERLETDVLPRILQGKTSADQVRVWVTGCATGEEAYSIAMLLAERTHGVIDAPSVQIFASDIDEQAITTAREGLYTLNDAADVSPERLRRYFVQEQDGYRVRRELREMILFANHNLLKDPPFSHLDLATCRNLLIYLNGAAQERVMETLHFALNPGGYLFLGSSESVDGASDLYAMVDRESHLYQSRETSTRMAYPVPELSPTFRFNEPPRQITTTTEQGEKRTLERITYGDLHQRLLEQYAPPSIVVNEEYDIVHVSERAGRYLQVAGGELSPNLLKLIHPELRLELRTALYQAVGRRTNVEARNLKVNSGEGEEWVNIYVRPVMSADDTVRGFVLVLFEQANGTGEQAELAEAAYTSQEPVARQLEEELIRSKTQLRLSAEQHEVQAEELKAANEELQSINEELRSSSEELETSKEELQSVNEELTTVNQELKVKIEELSQSNNNFQNLINSTDIGTVFLDRGFRVRLFTPAARQIFNLIPFDIGRPLSDITHRLEYDNLTEDATKVLERLHTVEREVRTTDGRTHLMQITPYRTMEDRINSVVVAFVDISERKRAEEAVQASEERLQKAINIETVGVLFFNNDIEITDCNEAFVRMSGYTRKELQSSRFSWEVFTPDGFAEVSSRAIEELNTTGTTTPYEKEYIRKDGSRFWAMFAAKRISENEVVEFVTDITEQKRAEAAVRELDVRYRAMADTAPVLIWEIDESGVIFVNGNYLDFFGVAFEDVRGLGWAKFLHPDDAEGYTAAVRKAFSERQSYVYECRFLRADGQYRWLRNIGQPVGTNRFVGCSVDITKEKRTEANLAFLAEVTQDLARLTNIDETLNALGEKIAAHLGLSACAFAELDETAAVAVFDYGWHRSDVASLLGTYQMEEFMTTEVVENCRAGETVIVRDVFDDNRFNGEQYAALNIGSFVSIPLVRDGKWHFLLVVYRTEPYNWRDDEIELIRELTNRIWTRLERARAEAALREADERLQISIKGANIFTWAVNPLTGETTYSSNYKEVIGFEIAADAKENFLNVPAEEREKITTAFKRAMSGAEPLDVEHRVINPETGEISWVRAQGQLGNTRDKNTPPVFLGITQNITARKQAEEALRESEGRLRALVENLPGGAVFIVDDNLRYLIAEGEALAAAGFAPADLIGHTVAEAMSPELAAQYEPMYRRALAGEVFEHEHDAHNRTFLTRGVPLHATDDEVYAVLAVSYDITERIAAEEAMRESEERFRATFEQANVGIVQLDFDGRLLRVNPGFCKIVGYTGDECQNLTVKDVTHPDDYEAEMIETRRLLAGDIPGYSLEKRYVQRDGSIVWGQMTTALVRKESGEPYYLLAIIEDITERKRAEAELKTINEQLEGRVQERTTELMQMNADLQAEITERRKAEQERAQILRRLVMAQEDERRRIARDMHDQFGQLLTALLLKLGLLKEDCREYEKLCEQVESAAAVARQLDRDVDFLVWELRPTVLDDLGLRDALTSFAENWSKHFNVPVEVHTRGMENDRLTSEIETTIYRIAQEALNNVSKHARAASVNILLERRADSISLVIVDDGAGFDAEEMFGGNDQGLGLVGMRERAALVGGTTEIESHPEEGTAIIVRLPAPPVPVRGEPHE